VTFTLAVTNNGPGAATGVQVTDTLPAGLGFVSISSSQGSCAVTSCSIGSMAEGGSANVTLVATTQAEGTIVNTASVSASTVDPVPANGTSSASVKVAAEEPPPPPELPAPEPGEVNLTVGSGAGQCVALKDGGGCQPLEAGRQVEIGDILYIDPGNGKVEVQSIVGIGAFYGGKFNFTELPGTAARSAASAQAKPILVVKLFGGSFKQCATKASRFAAGAAVTNVQAAKKPVRRLWGKGKGRFRTRGRYASGTVRGTNWVTEDYCDGTRIRVVTGIVQVWDSVLKKLVLVHPGESYFAAAKKKK